MSAPGFVDRLGGEAKLSHFENRISLLSIRKTLVPLQITLEKWSYRGRCEVFVVFHHMSEATRRQGGGYDNMATVDDGLILASRFRNKIYATRGAARGQVMRGERCGARHVTLHYLAGDDLSAVSAAVATRGTRCPNESTRWKILVCLSVVLNLSWIHVLGWEWNPWPDVWLWWFMKDYRTKSNETPQWEYEGDEIYECVSAGLNHPCIDVSRWKWKHYWPDASLRWFMNDYRNTESEAKP